MIRNSTDFEIYKATTAASEYIEKELSTGSWYFELNLSFSIAVRTEIKRWVIFKNEVRIKFWLKLENLDKD